MGKAELRTHLRAGRAAGHEPSGDLVDRVLAHVPRGSSVCCYVSLPGEPPTGEVIEALLARRDSVFLPVAGADGALEWVAALESRPWDAWGLPGRPPCPAPRVDVSGVDIVVVPALAITPRGQRLGQGGGYYDRFLPGHPHARTLALVWSDEVLPDVFAQPHDVIVDGWVIADG